MGSRVYSWREWRESQCYRDTQNINFNIYSTKDKPVKKDSDFFGRLSINLSLENHSKSRRFDSCPMSYAFDNNSRKTNSSDDSAFSHVAQHRRGESLHSFVRSTVIIER